MSPLELSQLADAIDFDPTDWDAYKVYGDALKESGQESLGKTFNWMGEMKRRPHKDRRTSDGGPMWSWNPWGSNSIVPITEPKKFTAEYTREEHEAEYHSLPKSLWNEHTNKVYYSLYDAIEGLRKSLELSAHMKYWK